MKKCPFCGEEIQDEAIKCKYCKEFINKTQNGIEVNDVANESKLSEEDKERLRKELACPKVTPQDFDVTYEGWLQRIGTWGTIRIAHINPEYKEKREVNKDIMVRTVSDPESLRLLGAWSIDSPAVNICIIYRDYVGLDGRDYREAFNVEVDLRPDLKKAMKWWKF